MKNNILLDDECLDDLQLDNLMIIQKQSGYKFSTDSVLLANFAKIKHSETYVDLCSGSGVIAILAYYKNKPQKCFAVEIQSEVANMAKRTMEYNGLDITVLNENLTETYKTLGSESVDVITINPPYNNDENYSNNIQIALSTHEISVNLEQIALFSSKLLKFGGRIYMSHRADRLAEIMFEFKKYNLEPKILRVVYPKKSKEPNLVLIEAKKGAKPGLKILSPLIINNEDGTETEEIKEIYNRRTTN